jgi:hypothetical protein
MSIKRWSDFHEEEQTNEKMKTFSKKKSEEVKREKPTRSQVSASSEYADDINQNIIKQKKSMPKTNNRKYTTKREEEVIKDKSIYPPKEEVKEEEVKENVEFIGRVAKFPGGVKASKAFNWMHNLQDPKLSKKDIWYLMVEKQDNELQMIKYQQKQGVNLTKFISDLKFYYEDKYKNHPKLVEKISKIKLGGDKEGNISAITNIPNVKVEGGKKLIQKITEDLVKLLG